MKNKDSETTLHLLLLGTPRLEIGDEIIEIDTRKAIAILAYIAVQREPTTREFLAAMLWPELNQSRARAALRRTLSALRNGTGEQYLEISRESVGINPIAAIHVDAWDFQDLVILGEQATTGQLQTAAALYRDHFMTGFTLRDSPAFDEWQYYQEQKYRRDLAGILERLIERAEMTGDWPQAIDVARRWLAQDPLYEAVHRTLMRLYALAGERTMALRQFEQCRQILAEELGVEPLAETIALADQIRDNQLLPLKQETPTFTPPVAAPAGRHQEWPLIGREQEWQALWQQYHRTGEAGSLVVIEGEAGIGKTRLATEFLNAVAAQGATTVTARCFSGESDVAYGPLVEAMRDLLARPGAADLLAGLDAHWLAEGSRLLPELRTIRPEIPVPLPAEDISAQDRLYAAFAILLKTLSGGDRPGLFLVDDVQWAHEATRELLTYLVHRPAGGQHLFLLTWRDADVPPEHPLRTLLAAARRSGRATYLHLNRLNEPEIQEMVFTAVNPTNEKQTDLATRLYRETEGNPFFAVEYLTLMAEVGRPDWPMPGSVRDLLHSRLAGLSQMETQLLQTAAVIGRSFLFEIWQEASGRSVEETIAALDQLLRRGLVQELSAGEPAYDFSHEKLRELVLDETNMARRRLLHLRVADAILAHTRRPERLGPQAAQIGYHYERAARPDQAAEYYYQAGEHAQAVFANREAITLYDKALGLGEEYFTARQKAHILESLGDCYALSGEYGAAIHHFQQAVESFSAVHHVLLERKIGDIYHLQGKWKEAEDHFAIALRSLDEVDLPAEHATILAAWSRTVLRQGDNQRALQLIEQSLALAMQVDDERALAQAHNIRGMLARHEGNLDLAVHHLENSLALAERLENPGVQVAALNNLALVQQAQGETGRALSTLNRALQLCEKQGDRHREAAIHNNLADVLHVAGREGEAMHHLKQSVAIYAEIGNEDGRWQPEIWKLTTW